VVPPRYVGTPPTRGVSYVIAVVAFVLSMAFWSSVGAAAASLWRLRRRSVAAQGALHPAAAGPVEHAAGEAGRSADRSRPKA
jgi:hypothetical protein